MLSPQAVEKFKGILLPARFVQDPETLRGKRVLVVGGGKTALDIADISAGVAAETTQLFRRVRHTHPASKF